MQYCVASVRLDPSGAIDQVEWGPLDGHPLVLISDRHRSEVTEVMQLIRRGKLVWALFPTPGGLALGGLLRLSQTAAGATTLDVLSGDGRPRTVQDMARF